MAWVHLGPLLGALQLLQAQWYHRQPLVVLALLIRGSRLIIRFFVELINMLESNIFCGINIIYIIDVYVNTALIKSKILCGDLFWLL